MENKAVLTAAAAVALAVAGMAQAQTTPNLAAAPAKAPGTVAAPSPATLSYLQPSAPAKPAVPNQAAPAKPAEKPPAAAPAPVQAKPAPIKRPVRVARKTISKPAVEATPALPGTFDLNYSGDIWKALQLVAAKQSQLTISAQGSPFPMTVHLDLRGADLIEALRAIGDQTGDAADLVFDNQNHDLKIVYKARPVAAAAPALDPAAWSAPASSPIRAEVKAKPGPAASPIDEVKNWQNGAKARPIAGPDGMLLYPFGQMRPTLTCKPLRGCAVQLQQGEVVNNVIFGDTVRWIAGPATVGSGTTAIQQVVVKPTEDNIATNMRITTNRRAYVLEVNSNVGSTYIDTIGYYYPQDMVQEWNGQAEVERRKSEEDAARKVSDLPIASIDQINLDSYRLKGDRSLPWYPVRVFDEGTHVWIQMPPAIKASEAPALVLVGSDGNTELVNYRVKEAQQGGAKVTYYIVDKLFAKAALIVGVGGEQQKVEIIRNGKGSAWFGFDN